MQEQQQTQLQLPYMEITKVANRDTIRANTVIGKTTYWIDFDKLKIRDGFNLRREYNEIPELALFIEFNGIPGGPLTVDMMPDGDICYIEIGHRRYKALELLIEQKGGDISSLNLPGIKEGKIECFVNDYKVDELTRLKRQYSSNNGEKYTSLEIGELCLRMQNIFELTLTDIGRELGLSRQTVKNMITLAEQSDDVKQAIKGKTITPTAAVDLVHKLGDSNKVTDKIQEAVSSGAKITVNDVKRLEGEDSEGNAKGKKDKDSGEIFDESRLEIKLCQNVIKNVDRLNTMASKSENEQFKTDFDKTVGYIQKDMVEIRNWIKKHKKH